MTHDNKLEVTQLANASGALEDVIAL